MHVVVLGAQAVVEHVGVGDGDAVDEPAQHPSMPMRCERSRALMSLGGELDVDVAGAAIQRVRTDAGLEVGTVVGPESPRWEREALGDAIEEPDRVGMVGGEVNAQPGAGIDGGELAMPVSRHTADRSGELLVDLRAVA